MRKMIELCRQACFWWQPIITLPAIFVLFYWTFAIPIWCGFCYVAQYRLDCILVIIGSAYYVYRSIAKALLRKLWTTWPARRAIDTSFVGVCLLFCEGGARHMPEQMAALIHPGIECYGSTFSVNYMRLEELTTYQWLLDNFAQFSILPALIVAFIGYSIERNKSKLAAEQARQLASKMSDQTKS
jgi:hypothetical protein